MATSATRPLRNRIALFFDFDETLGPSTNRAFFEHVGLSYDDFDAHTDQRIKEKWQPPLAASDLLREYSHREDSPVRRDKMEAFAREFPLFEEADRMVPRLRKYVADIDDKIELEFVLLTAGYRTIPAHTVIGEQFDRVYGGELEFDHDGRILGARRVISHVDKVHYIKQFVEGLDLEFATDLEDTYIEKSEDEEYIPMEQLIYVGDGNSDMSAFQIVEEGGGVAVAINPSDGAWTGYDEMSPGRRVHNVAPADYKQGSELMKTLRLSLDLMIARIRLLRLGKNE